MPGSTYAYPWVEGNCVTLGLREIESQVFVEPELDVAEGLPLQPLTLQGKLGSKIVGILLPLTWVTGTRYAFSTDQEVFVQKTGISFESSRILVACPSLCVSSSYCAWLSEQTTGVVVLRVPSCQEGTPTPSETYNEHQIQEWPFPPRAQDLGSSR